MIAAKTWREIRLMTLVYAVILELMLVPAILLWPDVQPVVGTIGALFPMHDIREMFRAMASADRDAAYTAYAAVQLFFKGTNVVGVAAAVVFGPGMIARERENQTLEFLLARPVSRGRLLWSKFLVTALAITVPIFVTSWTAIPISTTIDEKLGFWPVTLAAFHASVFAITILAFTCLFSIKLRTQVHVAAAIGGLLILNLGMFFIPIVRVASVFRATDFYVYGPVMAGNVGFAGLFWSTTVWLLLAAVAAWTAAWLLFRRADL